jgi:hypothetical protein
MRKVVGRGEVGLGGREEGTDGGREGEQGLDGRVEKGVEKHGGKKREGCKMPRFS